MVGETQQGTDEAVINLRNPYRDECPVSYALVVVVIGILGFILSFRTAANKDTVVEFKPPTLQPTSMPQMLAWLPLRHL